ncbi:protein S-acyltransferase 18 [Spinacia oleracea]|uniref:S-acyltransferase n=1 Tax=Spinacia oleracea TaxID=3562 RepID=A0A9R0JMM4_SPIOL|nr:protein S-acyltransferase 18 [Spinacia oleracea]XP_021839888.2 protein S-acyltransferase 18 [Spinacia oleracea]XP_021839889.2 protein S-acyltransferase 18 [Spinacia oleracea]XP_021839891.2 protein S-acyltransferase 18 [Spinacia oleracea]XP_056685145.1 protein S-acyltransferase 18 [Spinacia oleracea]XP_056685146.1 protein S-acyltransferase 18 [Spinacia oleracea]XP_056685147.1 protein S-acyltransferase 18 [Spinacia oleracea]
MYARRHGWQRPLHPLQVVGMALYSFLVAFFYCFLWPFLGNRIAEIVVITVFSSVAFAVMVLFIRCTATDPSAKNRHNNHKRKKVKRSSSISKTKTVSFTKLNYGFIFRQMVMRCFRRMERKILKTYIRRKYLLDPRIANGNVHLDPLLPFPLPPLVTKEDDDSVSPEIDPNNDKEDDFSFCSLCNFHVKKHSKHCRTCNRCVEGFDHHCRWLNNCVGKRNYTTFILLMICVLLMLAIEGGIAIAIFIRCFAYKKDVDQELARVYQTTKFPRGILAAISAVLVLMTAYGSAALGQLFFFHVVLIRKGMRTYDYILAMREEHRFSGLESFNDSDFSSDDSSQPDSPKRPMVLSQFIGQRTNLSPEQLSVKIDPNSGTSILNQHQNFHASIDPWKLIQMSKEKALKAAEKAKERQVVEHELNPLPFEMKSGLLVKPELDQNKITPLVVSKSGSPGRFSSPRRRFSGSSATMSNTTALQNQIYRSNFDLKLTGVSRELEGYISKQVLCSIVKDGTEASPR